MELAAFQERLSQQYARLRDLRLTENYPVYAIEHGLSVDERSAAQALLNANLNATGRADEAHWLVWSAAAAEIGYQYDGTEYWDSFATAFPCWPQYGDRNQIRRWYKRFASEFGGLTPSGPWARQFPIIAWPITQAVLPRYLQHHFAEHLYQLRHALVRSGELTLDEIGDLLSDRYFGGSSRFEGFLQQKALTARIVMALGLESVADTVAPIEAATLGRIVRDFDRLGLSGSRLREARRVLRDVRFVNSAKQGFVGRIPTPAGADSAQTGRRETPRLVAHQTDATLWKVRLAVPDLATPLRQLGISPHDLERARMRFRARGEGNTWMPARALFSYTGQSTEPLHAYPISSIQIFEFDQAYPQAEAALRERLTFPAQPLRVLKVRTDGSAFEMAGRHVRADHSYLLVTAHSFADDIVRSLSLSPLPTDLAETHLWQLDVGTSLSVAQIAALKSLGLGYVLGVRMEPLGLSPRWHASNGAMEFLDSEAVLFSLSSDVAVREFSIAIDACPPVRIKAHSSGQTLVSFGSLSIGPHSISVSALGAATGADLESEAMAIEVRSSLPWQQAIAGKAGVTIALEPRQASLEQLFNRDALIRLAAPQGRQIKLEVRFYGADGMLFHQEMLGQYTTPVADKKLSELVVHRLTSAALAEHVERAVRIDLAVSLDEYGAESITFEKYAEPLRWVRLNPTTLRLSDDSAGDEPPVVDCYDLSAVDRPRRIAYESALERVELDGKGGLLVVKHDGRRYGTIVTVTQSQLASFSDLGVPASLSKTSVQPANLINALKRWTAARRLIGPMAFLARRNAISALEGQLELLLCGEDWVTASNSVRSGKSALGDLYGRVYYSRGFASGLRTYDWHYEVQRAAAIREFLRLTVEVYKVSGDEPLNLLALKLAFAPSTVASSDLPSKDAFKELQSNAALIRGAYFARLAADMRVRCEIAEAA